MSTTTATGSGGIGGLPAIVFQFLLLIIGGVVGFLFRVLTDWYSEPKLEMAAATTWVDVPVFQLAGPWFLPTSPNQSVVSLRCYRARVTNRQKRFMNAPARNCVAWIDVPDRGEPLQVSWVGSNASVTINVGDSREVDVFALV